MTQEYGSAGTGTDAETRHILGGYREYAAAAPLADCVESLWVHQTPSAPVVNGAAHRVLPDPGVSVGFLGFRDATGAPVDWAPVIVGPKLRAQMFALVPGRELTAIRVKAEWVGPLLGIDPVSIEDRVDPLGSVMPRLAERLGDELSRTRSAAEALRTLAAALRRLRADCHTAPSAITSHALDIFRDTAGRTSCERVAARLGLSERHVRRHVHDATGMAPKAYSRAVRFVAAMVMSDRLERPAWADIALRAGYCDQSHLIRDAVALAGVSPRDLHVERRRQVAGDMSVLSNPR